MSTDIVVGLHWSNGISTVRTKHVLLDEVICTLYIFYVLYSSYYFNIEWHGNLKIALVFYQR
jgi:hypothetical protein